MDWLWYILIGIASGVFAGMGMGGGTFLIPLLSIFMNTKQIFAQGINLIVFVPMAVVVSVIYFWNGLIDWRRAWIVMIPATIVSVFAAVFAVNLSGKILKIIFGTFIGAVGIFQLVMVIIKIIKNKTKAN